MIYYTNIDLSIKKEILKTLIVILLFLGIVIYLPLVCNASLGTSYNIGNTTYYNFSDEILGNSYIIGGTTYYNFSDGTSGTSSRIGNTTYYNFNDPLSNKPYHLGTGYSNNYPTYNYVPGEFYSTDEMTLITNLCQGVDRNKYPEWGTRGMQLTNKCLETICPEDDCNSVEFQNGLNRCTHQGPEEALKEILDLCFKERAEQFINRINIAIQSNNNLINKTATQIEKKLLTKIDKNLSKRISGNILLQVESKGEGWYVFPDDKKKYYLGKPADAFSIMRNLGLGIKHNEIADYLNTKFPDRLSGKIMLDVEQKGEAYYVNPKDLKGYYLNKPTDAFRIMRESGLGITNSDIRKIDVGEIE